MVVPRRGGVVPRGAMRSASVGGGRAAPETKIAARSSSKSVEQLEGRTTFHDPDVTSQILETLHARQPVGVLRQGVTEVRARITPESSGGIGVQIPEEAQLDYGQGATLCVDLYDVLFVLEGELILAHGRSTLGEPVRISCVNRRSAARLPLRHGEGRLHLAKPSSSGLEFVAADVRDLACDGASIAVPSGEQLPTDRFPALIELGSSRIPCLAEVRHRTQLGAVAQYGVRIETSHRASIVSSYLGYRFPELVDRARVDVASVSSLLNASGYLSLRAETRPSQQWFGPADLDGLSRDVCYIASDGAVTGHFSITRAYSRAWLGHQMATLKGHESTVSCRRTLYLHVAAFATSMDGEETTVLGYFDRQKPWHRIFFYDFVKWVGNPADAVITELDRFEREHPQEIGCPAAPADVEIDVPTAEELVMATAVIRTQLPHLVADSLDIRPDQLECSHLHEAYRGTRYERSRTVRVLRVGGTFAGVALCELGSRDLSLFNLFNMAFFFFVPGSHAPSTAAQLALLAYVRALYAARGEYNPMIVAPAGTFDATAEPGTVLAETMGLIAKSGRSLRQYECFIRYQFGRYMDERNSGGTP